MTRIPPPALLVIFLLSGCSAKKPSPVTDSTLVGSWTADRTISPNEWTKLEFRNDGSAEFRLHQSFVSTPNSMNNEMSFGGSYRLVGDKLTVVFDGKGSMASTINGQTVSQSGSLAQTPTSQGFVGDHAHMLDGNLVVTVKGKERTYYPWTNPTSR